MKYFEVFKAGNYPQGKFTKEEVQELAKNYDPITVVIYYKLMITKTEYIFM